jgi:adenine-specific DNA-methyltransferase
MALQRLIYPGFNASWQPKSLHPIEVIDGPHRLWAFDEDFRHDYELPVVAFVGLDVSLQAYLFWTINIKPKKINPSLAFDLYPLLRTEDWLEQADGPTVYRDARAQELTEALWAHTTSPWYQRINMLGQTQGRLVTHAVVSRTQRLDAARLEKTWLNPVRARRSRYKLWRAAPALADGIRKTTVVAAREICEASTTNQVSRLYGGYYSPQQAITFDLLLRGLPTRKPDRAVCHAALLMAASKCAAAPGHTAQPFRPTPTARPYIHSAWEQDPLGVIKESLAAFAQRHARCRGSARVADALSVAKDLREGDLAIVDPPYSAVQYSRFYHVLEVMARPTDFAPEGHGRYPPFAMRPRSSVSVKSEARKALETLLNRLAEAGSTAILTFPVGDYSNGLSGTSVTELAAESFQVVEARVGGRFSTLGGNNSRRPSRHPSEELILSLRPR